MIRYVLLILYMISASQQAKCYVKDDAFSEAAIDYGRIVAQVIEEQPDAIQNFQKGKLYLKVERIFLTTHGIFLYDNLSTIKIPELLADKGGCYIKFNNSYNDYIFYQCTNRECKFVWNYRVYGGTCPLCGHRGKLV